MSLSRISSRCLLFPARSCTRIPACRLSSLPRTIRWSSTTTPLPRPISQRIGNKNAFPPRLLIYHAGTGRSVFLGCLKVTTIFIFSFFSLVVAPTYWYAEGDQRLVAVGIMLSGIVPMAFVAYISSPFVANVHLRLPVYARRSRDILHRYTRNLPEVAELEITSMNFIGKPRRSLVRVADLRPVRERFGMVNYSRDTKKIDKARPWYVGKAVGQFGIHGGVQVRDMQGIWDNVIKSIKKH